MNNHVISFNALYIDQISTMRQLVANIAAYDFNKFSYDGLRLRIKDECRFLDAKYIIDGQNSHGYKKLMSCEDSDLLTNIAHGLNCFIKGNTKIFNTRKKTDLEGVFLDYRKQLDFLCRATLSELNCKSDLVFELSHVSAFTSERVNMINNGIKTYSLTMAELLPNLQEDMKRKEKERAIRENDFAAVITEESLKNYDTHGAAFTFYRPDNEILSITVSHSETHKYTAYLSIYSAKSPIKRKILKREWYYVNTIKEILSSIREFLKIPVQFGELVINDSFEITFESGLTVTAIKTSAQCCMYQKYGKLKASIVTQGRTVHRVPEAPEMAFFQSPDNPRHSYIVKRPSMDEYSVFKIFQHKEKSREKFNYQPLVDAYDFIDMDAVDKLQYNPATSAQRLSDLKWLAYDEKSNDDVNWREWARNRNVLNRKSSIFFHYYLIEERKILQHNKTA